MATSSVYRFVYTHSDVTVAGLAASIPISGSSFHAAMGFTDIGIYLAARESERKREREKERETRGMGG